MTVAAALTGAVMALATPFAVRAEAADHVVERLAVAASDADGTATAASLLPGVTYTLEVRGTFGWGADPTRRADAECSGEGVAVAWQPGRGPDPAFLDLLVDGQEVDWQPVVVGVLGCDAAGHRYRLAWTPHQAGPLALRVAGDPAAQEGYTGELQVAVLAPAPVPAPAPGPQPPAPAPAPPAPPAVLAATGRRAPGPPSPAAPAPGAPPAASPGPSVESLADLFGAVPSSPARPRADAGDGTTAFVPAATGEGAGGAVLLAVVLAGAAALAPAAAAGRVARRHLAARRPAPVEGPEPAPVHPFEQSFFAPEEGMSR